MNERDRDQLLKDIERAIWTAQSQNLTFVVHILAMAYLEAMENAQEDCLEPAAHH